MIRIKFDINIMKFISMFESLTNAKVKDCIDTEGMLVFIVEQGEMAKAIGKKGINVKKIENIIKKKIKVIEYSSALIEFVQNVIMPLRAEEITEENKIVTIKSPNSQTRGLLIGRSAVNLRGFEKIVQRYFDVKEIKVI